MLFIKTTWEHQEANIARGQCCEANMNRTEHDENENTIKKKSETTRPLPEVLTWKNIYCEEKNVKKHQQKQILQHDVYCNKIPLQQTHLFILLQQNDPILYAFPVSRRAVGF